jgi:hypothetical protein
MSSTIQGPESPLPASPPSRPAALGRDGRWSCLAHLANQGNTIPWWPILFAGYCVSTFVPWMPRSWQPPCNNAWALVLHDDFIRGRACGVDTVWTFGPYGFLYFGALQATYIYTILGWLLICGGYVAAVLAVMRKALLPDWAKLFLSVIVTACATSVDVVDAQVFAFAAFALAAGTVGHSGDRLGASLTGAALALCSLTKWSWCLAIAPLVGAMIVAGLVSRPRRYVVGGMYLVSLIVLWWAAGQSLGGVHGFVIRSMEVVHGYSQAQQLTAPWTCLAPVFYVAAASIIVLVPLYGERIRSDMFLRAGFCTGIAFLSFVVFKAGFVRHDHHETVAAAFLVALAVLMLGLRRDSRGVARTCMALTAFLVATFAWTMFGNMANPWFQPRIAESTGLRGLRDLSLVLSGRIEPAAMIAKDLAAIAAARPLDLSADRTVDVYPWGGVDLVFASGAHIRHRPIFESYSAYTPALAELNREFLAGANRPNTVLFAARSIDSRFPAMDDGLSWPVLLSQYDIHSSSNGFLELRERKDPLQSLFTFMSECRLSPRTAYPVPADGLVWMSIDIPLSRFGRLLAGLYRPSVLGLRVRLADGTIETFRLVPGCAKAGFLVSPAILGTADWASLHRHPDGSGLAHRRVVEFAVIGPPGFQRDYDFERASLRISTLSIAASAPAAAGSESGSDQQRPDPDPAK